MPAKKTKLPIRKAQFAAVDHLATPGIARSNVSMFGGCFSGIRSPTGVDVVNSHKRQKEVVMKFKLCRQKRRLGDVEPNDTRYKFDLNNTKGKFTFAKRNALHRQIRSFKFDEFNPPVDAGFPSAVCKAWG